MKRLLILSAIGLIATFLTACEMPPVIFSLPQGGYGWHLDMEDPLNPVPVLEPVYLGNEGPFDFIFFTLDDSDPFCWDISNSEDPNWLNVANLAGPIPYIDTRQFGGDTDLRTLTAVGIEALFHLDAGDLNPALHFSTTIKAISCNQVTGDFSPLASHTYIFDISRWDQSYTVEGNAPSLDPPIPADVELRVLIGLVTSATLGGGGFTTIDGDLTITGLQSPFYPDPQALPLGTLYGCVPQFNAPGCLSLVTGDLIIKNNPYVTTAEIEDMAAAVTPGGSLIHCGNFDDAICEEE